MVVTKIDAAARKILQDTKEKMQEEGIEHPNLSDAIRELNRMAQSKKGMEAKE